MRKRSHELILISAVLCLAGPIAGEKRVIRVESSESPQGYSTGIEAGDFIYFSGFVGSDRKGALAGGDIAAQTRQALDNLSGALRAAGLGFDKVVSTNVYLTDIRRLDAVNRVYGEYFRATQPARTVLEAVLMNPGALVEISAIAAA